MRATAEHSLPSLTEAALVRLWEGRRFPQAALVTRAGVALRVLHPGHRGRGPGPDFRGAVLAGPSGIPLRGDIELHLRSSSFRSHGHHTDPAYRHLVLHVVLEDDGGGETALPGGRGVPVVALQPWVNARRRELEAWLAQPPLVRDPCADAIARQGVEAVAELLDRLGDGRLREKAATLAGRAAAGGWDQALWEGLLEALGYGGARELLAAVGRALPWQQLALRIQAALPGAEVGAAEALLLRTAEVAGREHAPSRVPCRPANRPQARLRAAARLAVRHRQGLSLLLDLLPAHRPADLLRPFVVEDGTVRLGRGRAREVAVNVLLPAALAAGRDGVADAFAALPAGRYGRLAPLEQALAGVRLNARRGQGLLALERGWCARGDCGCCPLAS